MASNAERLGAMYSRFWKDGDWNVDRGLFAPDIEWIGIDQVGLDGERHGVRGVGRFFTEWLEAWEAYDNDVEIHEVTPDLIVTHSRFRARGRGSGIEFETELGQVWEFENGLIVRQRMYRTYEEAREAADVLLQRNAG